MTGPQAPGFAPPASAFRFVLASRSPQRLDLLSRIVPRDDVLVLPPSSAEEPGFEGLSSRREIETRLRGIAAGKCDDVSARLGAAAAGSVVVAADTTIVVGDRDGGYAALGQPPEARWRETTRRWFVEHYAGRTHSALTAFRVAAPHGVREAVVETRVTFRADAARFLDWYFGTGEPRGRAGGYAIQGAGGLFVERLEGDLTNVVGLPLGELLDALRALGVLGDARNAAPRP